MLFMVHTVGAAMCVVGGDRDAVRLRDGYGSTSRRQPTARIDSIPGPPAVGELPSQARQVGLEPERVGVALGWPAGGEESAVRHDLSGGLRERLQEPVLGGSGRRAACAPTVVQRDGSGGSTVSRRR